MCTFLFFHFDKTYRSRISNTSFIMYTILLSIECTVNAQTIEHKLLSILMPNIIIFLLKVIHKINKNLSAHFLLELSIYIKFNPYSAELKNGLFQFRILTNSFLHIRVFLAKIWKYDKQCSPWSEGSSRSPLIWV